MAMKPCLKCGRLSSGSYCARHTPKGWRDRPSPSALDRPPVKLRWQIKQRDGLRCQGCGVGETPGKRLQVHHRRPVARGGGHDPASLVTLCDECHRLVHAP